MAIYNSYRTMHTATHKKWAKSIGNEMCGGGADDSRCPGVPG